MLSSAHVEAFLAVSSHLSFSKAAKSLLLTQSALSQRILNFESELGLTLFIRESSGLRLSEAGHRMLKHCQLIQTLEQETLAELTGRNKSGKLSGHLAIGGFSSVMWSVVVPALSKFASKHPLVQFKYSVAELSELLLQLRTGTIQYAFLDYAPAQAGLESIFMGNELNYLVSAKNIPEERKNTYLDHDVSDQVTEKFLKLNHVKSNYSRAFFDDIYGIIAGVSNGFGQAVIPKHMLHLCKNCEVDKKTKPIQLPFYLVYSTQPYYSKLHNGLVYELEKEIPKFLS